MAVPSKRLAEYFFICGINYTKGLQNDTVAGKIIAAIQCRCSSKLCHAFRQLCHCQGCSQNFVQGGTNTHFQLLRRDQKQLKIYFPCNDLNGHDV